MSERPEISGSVSASRPGPTEPKWHHAERRCYGRCHAITFHNVCRCGANSSCVACGFGKGATPCACDPPIVIDPLGGGSRAAGAAPKELGPFKVHATGEVIMVNAETGDVTILERGRDYSVAAEGPAEKIHQALQVLAAMSYDSMQANDLAAVNRLLREALALLERKPE